MDAETRRGEDVFPNEAKRKSLPVVEEPWKTPTLLVALDRAPDLLDHFSHRSRDCFWRLAVRCSHMPAPELVGTFII